MQIDEDVIDRNAEEGARVVALALVAECDRAAGRLAIGEDDEALHDFRVALRRLRTTLRAFRPWLEGSVRRRMEKLLRKLARATNAARDAEVQLAWLSAQRVGFAGRQQIGLDFLCDRIAGRRDGADGERDRLLARYARISGKLARRLQTYEGHVDASAASGPFGGVLGMLLSDQVDALRQGLGAIRAAGDDENVHRTRIEAKRLRYLLEPLRGNRHADARDVVKRLKSLQDALGELHDCHVLAGEIASAFVDAAAERARKLYAAVYEAGASGAELRDELRGSARPGLLALARVLRERRDALFAGLERDWREGIGVLAAETQAIAGALEARAGGKVESERKYLLAAVPPRAEEVPAFEIAQGWLPGARLHERVRRVRGPEGERYWRGLKQGTGRQRLEADEETSREVFEALWPFTEGRRVSKRRRKVDDAGLTWEIDQFLDRDLILAEVELSMRTADAPLPEWLRPLVVREVTDDPAYHNEALALSAPGATRSEREAPLAPGPGEPPEHGAEAGRGDPVV